MAKVGAALKNDASEPAVPASAPRSSVFGHTRSLAQPQFDLPSDIRINARNKTDGIKFLQRLPKHTFPCAFFDPQYRGVLDRQQYGNEGERQKDRAQIPQMTEGQISNFVRSISNILIPSGHLFIWLDKYHMCEGIRNWIEGTDLNTVDLVVWDKERIGMGYRTRRSCEYLIVLQKTPLRAKGVWTAHDIPDVWAEKLDRKAGHAKPIKLQSRLIDAVTNAGDCVIDPAAGTYSVLEAARLTNRHFLGCDIRD
jgi:site-specific DNA-methyltransferase (adenine-specific)